LLCTNSNFGCEVCEKFGLVLPTLAEPDSTKRLALVERIETLHRDHGQEPAVRECLAMALFNAAVVEPDSTQQAAVLGRLSALAAAFPDDPAVAKILAQAQPS
jgi:hypothetical protein